MESGEIPAFCQPNLGVKSTAEALPGIHRESGIRRDRYDRYLISIFDTGAVSVLDHHAEENQQDLINHPIVGKRKRDGIEIQAPRGFLEEMHLSFVIEKGTVC